MGPIVKASSYIVNIDDKMVPGKQYGPIYLGSKHTQLAVHYDTMCDWTVISNNFDIGGSSSAVEWKGPDGKAIT